MSEYYLVFLGEINESLPLNEVKQNFKERFSLSDIKVKYMFSGKEVILKKSNNQNDLLKCAVVIDELGGIAYIEQSQEEIHLPEGVLQDRRECGRRGTISRRHNIRRGLGSDRRIHQERRV